MANQRHKLPEQLQGKGSRYRGTSSITLMPPDARRDVPPCPRGMTKAARDWYETFCADPISQLVTPAAWPTVLRRVVLMAKREVVEKKIWDEPLTKGSMDQDVMNPLLALKKELSREIEKIDQGLGLLPQDQMRLGIAHVQREAGVADLRERLAPQTNDVIEATAEEVVNLDEMA